MIQGLESPAMLMLDMTRRYPWLTKRRYIFRLGGEELLFNADRTLRRLNSSHTIVILGGELLEFEFEKSVKPGGSRLLSDPKDIRLGDLIKSGSDAKGDTDVGLIGVPWDWSSSGRPGSRFAPVSIRSCLNLLSPFSSSSSIDLSRLSWKDYGDVKIAPGDAETSFDRITNVMSYASTHAKLSILLGGDHSITYPSLRALANEEIRLLVFDAHYDLRKTAEGRTSGSYLRECYESEAIGKRLRAAIIGIRNFANPSYLRDNAKKFGIKYYTFEDVEERGILDVMDFTFCPGVNSPGSPGLNSGQILSGVRKAASMLDPIVLDLVEIVPWADRGSGTSLLASLIALSVVEGKFEKKLRQ